MDKEFLSPRWIGRIKVIINKLTWKYSITFPQGATSVDVIFAILKVCNEKEADILKILLQTFNRQCELEKANSINLTLSEKSRLEIKGQNEAEYIYEKYGISESIVAATDFTEELNAYKAAKWKRRLKILGGIVAVVALVYLAVSIYNLPSLREMRLYDKILENRNESLCHHYYSSFPNGENYEEVMLIHSDISYSPITVVRNYMDKFPNGKYIDCFNAKYDSLYDLEIERFMNREDVDISSEAVEYMLAMLNYLKTSRNCCVHMTVKSNVDIKDFGSYPKDVRNVMLYAYNDEELPLAKFQIRLGPKDDLMFMDTNILSLTENFAESDNNNLQFVLKEGVNSSFGKFFNEEFVKIVTDDNTDVVGEIPELYFEYTIRNKETDGFPEIWEYTRNGRPENYILAIDVLFNVQFTIPDSDIVYRYSEVGNPGEVISNFTDIKDAYRIMTKNCFCKFVDKMSIDMGLEETYDME